MYELSIPAHIHHIYRLPYGYEQDAHDIISEIRGRGDILVSSEHFGVCMKRGSYSADDAMVIYTGPDEQISTLLDFTEKAQSECFDLIEKYSGAILADTPVGMIGLNTSYRPGPGNIQSIRRPHFHITGFRTKNMVELGVHTESVYIPAKIFIGDSVTYDSLDHPNISDSLRKQFAIREPNFLLNRLLGDRLKKEGINSTSSGLYARKIELVDRQPLSAANRELFLTVYRIALEILGNHPEVPTSEYLGFCVVLHKENDFWSLKTGFIAKEPGDAGGCAELCMHGVRREMTTDVSLLPDLQKVRERILGRMKES